MQVPNHTEEKIETCDFFRLLSVQIKLQVFGSRSPDAADAQTPDPRRFQSGQRRGAMPPYERSAL